YAHIAGEGDEILAEFADVVVRAMIRIAAVDGEYALVKGMLPPRPLVPFDFVIEIGLLEVGKNTSHPRKVFLRVVGPGSAVCRSRQGMSRRQSPFAIGILMQDEPDLLELIDAFGAVGAFAHLLHRGDQERYQNRDNGYDDEKLDERKGATHETPLRLGRLEELRQRDLP